MTKMNMNKRLKSVASLVRCNTSIIDVGCDHALLSIYLYRNKENVRIIASDNKLGPLKSAENNLIKYNLLDKIELKLNDGIKSINNVETVVISGMGGITISEILEQGNLDNVKYIVLSPNNEEEHVREKLYNLGYKIENELFIIDNDKKYFIMSYIKENDEIYNFKYSKILINNKDKTYINYLKSIIYKNKKIITNILNENEKKKILEKEIIEIEKIISNLK